MNTAVEIRNPLVSRVQQSIDITRDDSGRFHLTVKEGHDFGAALLTIALKALPEGASFTLDTRPCGGIDESIAAVIISRRLDGNKTLLTTEAGIRKLSTMRFVTVDSAGTPHALPGFFWQIETSPPNLPINARPDTAILNKLASYIEELEKPRERTTLSASCLETLIAVVSNEDTVRVTIIAPIRGNHGQLLQDYLQNIDTNKRVVVDLKDFGPDSTSGGHCVLMAAKLRKKDGAEPLQLENVPSSLATRQL
jgi:hypothetical protein